MKKTTKILLMTVVAALSAAAADISDLMSPDDVMLRRPTRAPAKAVARPTAKADSRAVERSAPVEKLVVVETNVVTDVVTQTNYVTQTDIVVKTNVVTDVVTQTNVVTQTDVVTQTNYVTQTDIVVKTNVVVQSTLDESAKRMLEAERNRAVRAAEVERGARESAEAARGEAEKKAVAERTARAAAMAEMERMKAELARAEEKLRAAETKAAVAEKKAAAAETARVEVASQVDEVARKALEERKARERAEAETRAAERRAETERNAAIEAARKLEAATLPQTAADKSAQPLKPQATVEKKATEKTLTGRDAVITAERMDFDRKEGVILFDRNVYVDDEQYQMHADRLFVFLETNTVAKADGKSKPGAGGGKPAKPGKPEKAAKPAKAKQGGGIAGFSGGGTSLKRLVAIGHVSITNETRSAYCARATYAKQSGKIVMYGSDDITPWILDPQQSKTPQYGQKITFWTISEQVEIEKPMLSGAALGKGKGGNPLDTLNKKQKQ